jgi:hypothetical protein
MFPSMASAVGSMVLPEALSTYAPPMVFSRMPELVAPVRTVVSSFVILFLAASLVSGFSKSADEIPSMLASLALIAFFAASTSQLMVLGLTVVDEVTAESGFKGTFDTANKVWSGYMIMAAIPVFPEDLDAEPDDEDYSGMFGWARQAWDSTVGDATEWVANNVNGIGQFMLKLPRILLVAAIMPIVAICFGVGAIIMVVMETLRFFIIYLASILLPLAVGALAVPSLRSMGMTYILSIVGVMSWPIGWMLVNMGTFAIFDTIIATLSGDLIREMHPQRAQEFMNVVSSMTMTAPGGAPVAQDTAVFAAVSALSLSVTSLLNVALLTLGLFVWMLLGSIGGAFAISKTFTTGAGFAAPMVGATMQGMAKAAGAALKLGAMGGMQAAAQSGGAAGMGTKGSYAAGQTLVNLSRSSGDGSSLVAAPDTARDERLRTSSQMAEKATRDIMARQSGGGKGGGKGP